MEPKDDPSPYLYHERNTLMTIGETIISLRRARGLSQEQLAEELNVSRQALSKWESDSSVPDTENVVRMCRFFDISADTLLGIDREPSSAQQTQEPEREQPSADASSHAGNTAFPGSFRVGASAARLIDRYGHLGVYLYALRNFLGFLLILAFSVCYLRLSRSVTGVVFTRAAFPMLLPAIFGGIAALFLLVRIVISCIVGYRMHKAAKAEKTE